MSDNGLSSWGVGMAGATNSGCNLRTVNIGEGEGEGDDEAMLNIRAD